MYLPFPIPYLPPPLSKESKRVRGNKNRTYSHITHFCILWKVMKYTNTQLTTSPAWDGDLEPLRPEDSISCVGEEGFKSRRRDSPLFDSRYVSTQSCHTLALIFLFFLFFIFLGQYSMHLSGTLGIGMAHFGSRDMLSGSSHNRMTY